MENFMCRFPHLFQQILEELDVRSFADCRLVGKSWLSFIANEKSTWIRVMKTLMEDQGLVNHAYEYIKEDPKEDKKLEKALKQCDLTALKKLIFTIRDYSEENAWKSKRGQKPLHFAAMSGQIEMCKKILANVSNKDPKDNTGKNPLYYAAEKGF